MSEHIVATVADRIARIEIRRPEKKNALTGEMYTAMANALDAAEADNGVRVIVIHGQPGVFTSGNDLADFLNTPPTGDDAPVFRFLHGFSRLKKPFVAAVSGVAVGVGTTMLLHCDLVYADNSARFLMPFVNLGLCPEAGSSLLLPMIAGHVRAAEMLMLGEPFDAVTAHEIGLINAVVPAEQLLDHTLERARKLAAQPPAAVRITKELLKRGKATLIAETMSEEGRLFKERLSSPEAREAFTAFFEKRKADFSRFD